MATITARLVCHGLGLAWVGLVPTLPLVAAPRPAPACFQVLSGGTQIAGRLGAEAPAAPRTPAAHLLPTADEERAGFVMGRVPLATTFGPAWVWDEPRPETSVALIAMRGEYRAAAVGMHALRAVDGLTPAMSVLSGPAGSTIEATQTDVRAVQPLLYRAGGEELAVNRFLVQAFPLRIERGTSAFLWLSIFVPPDATPGLYQGQLAVGNAAGVGVAIPVRLRVLDLDFRYPRGAWGAYLPGHFHRDTAGAYHNYASENWSAANLERYLGYWKTRGWTSPSLFHVYPDLACVDGKTVADFTDVQAVAAAMKRVGLEGPLCVDLRHTLWWAQSAGLALEAKRAAGQETSGRLDVTGADGQIAGRYGPDALRLWSEAIATLLRTAEREQWPPLLLLPEEEVTAADKCASYDASIATFKQAAGERTLLVDNEIGYGITGEIDRGHRDGIGVREYNNWTEAGLTQARADGAQVWSYNMGWTRAVVWLYTLRTGSSGYHQWADQWLHDQRPHEWLQTWVEADGVVTSTNMEMVHEALCDIAYGQRLEAEATHLDQAGHAPAAAAARQVLAALVAEAPVQRYEFMAWAAARTDADLELRRWRLVEAIGTALAVLGQAPAARPAAPRGPAASPCLAAAAPRQARLAGNPARLLHVNRSTGTITVDGRETEPCWAAAERAGPLWWTAAHERQMRAQAGSEEEFRRQYPPSYASARLLYGDEGLCILVNANHSTQEKARCTHADDDPELWADDCLEFFFQMPHDPTSTYQLIVNVRGARVLNRDRRVRPCGVRTGTISPVNDSGGYAQEIVVPWPDLGLKAPPEPGTVWRFNVCREFHSYDQLTCWAQVEAYFGVADGTLVFEGPAASVALRDLALGQRYSGRNRLSGRIEARTPGERPAYRVELAAEDGRVVAAAAVPATTDRFELTYSAPPVASSRTWRLAVLQAEQRLLVMDVSMPPLGPSVLTETAAVDALAGFRLALPLTVCTGDEDVVAQPLRGEIRDAGGRVYTLGPLPLQQTGPQRLWLDTEGLSPGPATLSLWLDGLRERGLAPVAVQVIASPFAP